MKRTESKQDEGGHWCSPENTSQKPFGVLVLPVQEEIAEMKRTEAKQEKLMHDVARENKRLTEPLSKVHGEVHGLLRGRLQHGHRASGVLQGGLLAQLHQCWC